MSAAGSGTKSSFDFTVDELKPGYVLGFTHNLIPMEEFPTESACPAKLLSSVL
jgi:hypothetical protein